MKRLYPGSHSVGIYFIDNEKMPINNHEIQLRFKCTIYSGGSIIFDKEFDVHEMERSGLGVKYIPGVNIGFFHFPVTTEDDSYIFHPKFFNKYLMNIEIIESSNNLCELNPVIGIFCPDIDQGYFGGEYILYNFMYVLLSIFMIIILFFIKKMGR
jgi:hypothetical protein